jgi:SOS-response transcriptional repressor LexA
MREEGYMSDASTRDKIFNFIVKYKSEHDGLAPSNKEMAQACFISISSVKHHIFMLEREDRIRVKGRRAIEVTGGNWKPPQEDE